MTDIQKIYEETSTDLTFEEFKSQVEQKQEMMSGLLDPEGAAIIVKKEVESGRINSIEDIDPSVSTARITAKVINVEDIREFDRDDGSEGKVTNVDIADESGKIKTVFWDDLAEEANEGLSIGDVIRIKGEAKDGYTGAELHVDKYEHRDTEIDVKTLDTYRVADLSPGLSSVTIKGLILDTSSVHTFDRDDGTEGQVGNIVIGDRTGQITVTLWGDAAQLAEKYRKKVSIEISNGDVRRNNKSDDLEIHISDESSIEHINESIDYIPPEPAKIEDIEIGERYTLVAVIDQIYDKDDFERDDGSVGHLRNMVIGDETSSLRVTLWGEKSDADLMENDKILLTNAEIREGMEGGKEASIGSRSTLNIVERGVSKTEDEQEEDENSSSRNSGLSSYQNEESSSDEGGEEPQGTESDTQEQTETEEETEFVGTVLDTGQELIIDDNGEKRTVVPADDVTFDVSLGERITVRGIEEEDKFRASEYF